MGDTNDFKNKGGMKTMSDALGRGMVLVMSLWDDKEAHMLWLDSTYPTSKTAQGGPRGSCPTSSGNPDDVQREHAQAYVKFGNIKVGEIGSTFKPGPGPTPSDCPGGSLKACMALCPSNPAPVYQACIETCSERCVASSSDSSSFLNFLY